MIRVANLQRSARFYERGFGLVQSHRMDFPAFSLVYLREPESGFEIELTVNHGETDPYTHGSGYGHIAFCVTDIAAQRGKLQALGYTVGDIKALHASNGDATFFFVTDPDGYKIEVLERAGHYV
jgi:lactoylglutathione lyase